MPKDDEPPVVVNRVLILGGPGSGKTTLAHTLASALRLPHQELDRMAYDPPERWTEAPFRQWTRVPDETRRERAAALAVNDRWVAEGLYAGWTAALRDAADVVIWLDLPAGVATWRVVKRALEQWRHGGRDWDVSSVIRVARGARSYRTRPPATIEQLRERDSANGVRTLEAFLHVATDRVVHCRSTRQVRRVIDLLSRPGTNPGL